MKTKESINGWEILYWLSPRKCVCQCKCGRLYKKTLSQIKRNKSCVCSKTKHGGARTKLYFVWAQMKGRCFNKNNPEYKNYGLRGITVCQEWETNAGAFLFWAEQNGYKDGLTLDRIDVNGNYEPTNCRWTNMHVQNANKRANPRNKSGATGVYKYENGRKHPFQAYVSTVTIGYYDTFEEAVEARKRYLIKNNLTEYNQ